MYPRKNKDGGIKNMWD